MPDSKGNIGIVDVQAMHDAAEQGVKDAAAAIKKGFKGFGAAMKAEREKDEARRRDKYRVMDSQRDLSALETAIREFVWAEMRLAIATLRVDAEEITKQQEQSSRMDTFMREQLEILNTRVLYGQSGARHFERMK